MLQSKSEFSALRLLMSNRRITELHWSDRPVPELSEDVFSFLFHRHFELHNSIQFLTYFTRHMAPGPKASTSFSVKIVSCCQNLWVAQPAQAWCLEAIVLKILMMSRHKDTEEFIVLSVEKVHRKPEISRNNKWRSCLENSLKKKVRIGCLMDCLIPWQCRG